MDPAQELELSALVMQKPMNDVIDRGDSNVQQFYSGATVFITGGSGFIGKQLIEKLFRSCNIEKMYLLMRPRKSKTIQDRLDYILKNQVYDVLKAKKPEFVDKICLVDGNVSDIRLGLSDENWSKLTNEVNVIFHAAATIRFDEPLRKATLTNIRSAREILELARNCKNLKKLVHVSTAFAYATKERIGTEIFEKTYSCPLSPDIMIALAEDIDEKKLDNITNGLIEGWPNTYTFTKCLAEELITKNSGDLPVCIVRPPIVLPAYIEPGPGWIDIATLIGPSGIYFGGGIGVLRVFRTDVNCLLSFAPVDYVNNTIIAAAWDSTERQKNGETEIPIYTISRDLRYDSETEISADEYNFCPWFASNNTENITSIDSPFMYQSSLASTPQTNTLVSCSSVAATPLSNKRKLPRKDKGNIRKRHVSEWIDVKRKALKNAGKEYLSRNGTIRPKKSMKASCPKTCHMKSYSKMVEQERLNIFNNFWDLGDPYMQWNYIASLVIKQKSEGFIQIQSNRLIGETMRKEKETLSSPKCLWRGHMLEVKNRFLYKFLSFFLAYIPALILDIVTWITGKRPKEITSFVDVFRKIDKLSVVYEYFIESSFVFREDNVRAMINRMSDADKAIYNCNLTDIDLKHYILVWGIGLRKYILKDGLTGTKAAHRKQQILRVLDNIILVLYAYVIWWVCSSVYLFVKYIMT